MLSCLALIALNALFLFRLRWVCQQRTRMNELWFHKRSNQAAAGDDISVMPWFSQCYAGFDRMLLCVWVWDIEGFRLPGCKEPWL